MTLPFQETKLSDNEFIRVFKGDTDSGHYHWHRDREDRIIEPINQTDWMIQIDNKLPIPLTERTLIPKGVYHRVIKGSGDLTVKVKKL
jgi:hypothetical protein